MDDFFINLTNFREGIKTEVSTLIKKLDKNFFNSSFLTQAEENLTELKGYQLMEAKTVLEIFIKSGDYDSPEAKNISNSKEFIKFLNSRLKNKNRFTYNKNRKKGQRYGFNAGVANEIDIEYTSLDGKTYFADVTYDSKGVIDFKDGDPIENQPIIKHFYKILEIVKKDKINDEDWEYIFVPNVINSVNDKLAERFPSEIKKTAINKSRLVLGFLQLLSKFNHLTTRDMDIADVEKYNSAITTTLYAPDFKTFLDKDSLTFVEILEFMKFTYNRNENNEKISCDENIVNNCIKELSGLDHNVIQYNQETIEEQKELIADSLMLNKYSLEILSKILLIAVDNKILTNEEELKLYNYFLLNNGVVERKFILGTITERSEKIQAQKQAQEAENKSQEADIIRKVLILINKNIELESDDKDQFLFINNLTSLINFSNSIKNKYLEDYISLCKNEEYQSLLNQLDNKEYLYALFLGNITAFLKAMSKNEIIFSELNEFSEILKTLCEELVNNTDIDTKTKKQLIFKIKEDPNISADEFINTLSDFGISKLTIDKVSKIVKIFMEGNVQKAKDKAFGNIRNI